VRAATGISVAVVGGSGVYELAPVIGEIGPASICDIDGSQLAFLNRHGPGHRVPPHAVDYHGNMRALAALGVRSVVATFACGSLLPEVGPGALVVPDQLIDRSRRRDTFFDTFEDGPRHTPFADPYDQTVRAALLAAAPEAFDGGTVVVIDGPRFATRAESRWYRGAGATLINMTQYPEAVLARELGMAYGAIGLVTDHDAGLDDRPEVAPVTQEVAFEVFAAHLPRLREVVIEAAVSLA